MEESTPPPSAEEPSRREEWLVRLVFVALLALTVHGCRVLHAEVPMFDWRLRTLLLVGGIAFACVGLLVPWGRFTRVRAALRSPDRHLALTSRVLGWFGAGLLPFVVVSAPWPVVGLVALLPLAAHGLWRGRRWTVWVWYPAAIGFAPSLGVVGLVSTQFLFPSAIATIAEQLGTRVDEALVLGCVRGFALAGLVTLALFAAHVVHETFLFHRRFAAQRPHA
jgi:hypothetical protein